MSDKKLPWKSNDNKKLTDGTYLFRMKTKKYKNIEERKNGDVFKPDGFIERFGIIYRHEQKWATKPFGECNYIYLQNTYDFEVLKISDNL